MYIITYGRFAARPQDCFAGVGVYLSAPTRELADKYKADFVARWPSLPVAVHATKDVWPTA